MYFYSTVIILIKTPNKSFYIIFKRYLSENENVQLFLECENFSLSSDISF
jgi:hypothetical protein